MPTVKYRAINPNLLPRRTKLEVPGWAGQNEPRANGSHEYPWHCIPFSEAARAGIEIPYPHEDELRVSMKNGNLSFDGDFGADDERRPPFRSFGREYYTYQILVDLKVEEGFAIKVETHPRFFTDTTGTVPIASAGNRPALVADDQFPGLQVSGGRQVRCVPSRRALRADHHRAGRRENRTR